MQVIRAAERADHDAIQALWEMAGLPRATPGEWEALMSAPGASILVAQRDNDVVGAVVTTFDGWRAYVYHAAVDPAHRHQGIGHQLMQEAERALGDAGANHVYVMVHEQNTEGLALVGATGYLPEGEIVLVKRLPVRV